MARTREIARPWTQQPHGPVQPSAWARSRGIASLLLPSAGLVDLVDGGTWATWGTAPVRSTGPHGVCIDTTAAFGGLLLMPSSNICAGAQSHVALVETTAVSGSYAGLIATASSDGAGASLALQQDATANWDLWLGGSNYHLVPQPGTAFGPTAIVMTGSASLSEVYVGGAQSASQAAGPTTQSSSRIILFGERAANASYATKGRLYVYAAFQIALSAADARYISANPWQLFAPTKRRIWVPSASSAVPSITAVYADSVTASSVVPRVTLDFA